MPRYEQRDVSFDIPRHWDDKTLVAFAEPPTEGRQSTPSLVMTRDALGDAATIGEYADRQLAELAQRLDGFELSKKEVTKIGGLTGVAIHFTSKGQSGPLEQRLVVVLGHRRSIYCFTATAPLADAPQSNPLFDRILGSVRFPAPGEEGA